MRYLQKSSLMLLLIIALLFVAPIEGCAQEPGDNGAALFQAAAINDYNTIKSLIAAGANINARDHDGATALMIAAGNGGIDSVETLLAAGAAVNTKDKVGRTILHYIIGNPGLNEAKALSILNALVRAGVDVSKRGFDANPEDQKFTAYPPPIVLAAAAGELEIIKILIAAGADINAVSNSGKTPLTHAAAAGHVEIVKLLLAAKAQVNSQDPIGRTALMAAAAYGNNAVVAELIAAGAKVDAVDNFGYTPLIFAAANEELGASFSLSDRAKIAAMAKSSTDYLNTVKALLAAGAKVATADRSGKTAFNYARERQQAEIIGLLETTAKAPINNSVASNNKQHNAGNQPSLQELLKSSRTIAVRSLTQFLDPEWMLAELRKRQELIDRGFTFTNDYNNADLVMVIDRPITPLRTFSYTLIHNNLRVNKTKTQVESVTGRKAVPLLADAFIKQLIANGN